MDEYPFANEESLMGGSTDGDFFGGMTSSLDGLSEELKLPSVTPGASPLHRGALEDEGTHPTPEDRTLASFGGSCMSIGSHVGDHSLASGQRGASVASLASDFQSAHFSIGDTLRSTDSINSRQEALRLLNSQQSLNSELGYAGHRSLYDGLGYPGETIIPSPLATNSNDFCPEERVHSMRSMDYQYSIPSTFRNPSVAPVPLPPVPKAFSQPPLKEGKPAAVKAKKTKTKKQKEQGIANGRKIRLLIAEVGSQHVFFGRGEPIRNNPGNIRFRSIVDKHYDEYQRASKKRKLEIKNIIEAEVTSNGSRFIVVTESGGKVSQSIASDIKVKDGTGHVLRDTPKRRANCWSWLDPSQEQLSWTTFTNKDGAALEQMFQEHLHRRTKVKVTIRRIEHLVDVTNLIMHSCLDTATTYRVRRVEPEESSIGGKPIYVSKSDGQFDPSSSEKLSTGTGGNTANSSSRGGSSSSGGTVQSNLYCSLGMAKKPEDETILSAFEASIEEISEAISSALMEDAFTQEESSQNAIPPPPPAVATRDAMRFDGLSAPEDDEEELVALKPPSRSSDRGGRGSPSGLGSSIVKRFKNTLSLSSAYTKAVRSSLKKRDSISSQSSSDSESQQEVTWLWRETKIRMNRHDTNSVYGDPSDCWVRYDEKSARLLEASYQAQNATGKCETVGKYSVDFGLMRQTNTSTGFQRQVRRVLTTSIPVKPRAQARYSSATGPFTGMMRKFANRTREQDRDDMTTSAWTAPTTTESASLRMDETITIAPHPNAI